MKRLYLSALAVVCASVLAIAGNALSVAVPDVRGVKAGSVFDVDIVLENDIVFSALQTDVYLSPCMELAMDEYGYVCWLSSRAISSHSISVYPQRDGALRIIIAASTARAFKNNGGTLFSMQVRARSGFGKGDVIALRNNTAVEGDATKHHLDDVEKHLPMLGDINGDLAVDVGDVNVILAAILNPSQAVAGSLLDVNKDGAVDVGDVNVILSMILDQSSTQDTSRPAGFWLLNMEPTMLRSNYDRIYRIEINGYTIGGTSEILPRYSGYPNLVGSFISVDPGDVNIKLYGGRYEDQPDPDTGGQTTTRVLVHYLYYDGNVRLDSGDKGHCVIYSKDRDPVFVPLGTLPAQTDGTAAVRLYNFMFDSYGVPTTRKVQLRMLDVDGDNEYHNLGKPIAFGEATDWELTYVHSSRQRRDFDIVLVDDEGNQEPLTWVNSSNRLMEGFTDYWTLYVDSAYAWYLRGVRDDKNYALAITEWTCR